MQEKIQFKSVRDFGEVINDTFQFVKQNLKPLLKTFFYFSGLFLIGGALANIIAQMNMQDAINSGAPRSAVTISNVFTAPMLFSLLFTFLNYVAITVSVLSFITIYVEKGRIAPSLEEVWGYFRYYFLRVLGSAIFIGVILTVSMMLLIIPFIYIFPAMSILLPIMVIENATFSYSFGKSFKLLNGQWWITAGTILILWIITYALLIVVTLPGILLAMTDAFIPASIIPKTPSIIFQNILSYLSQVFLIIPLVGLSLIYFNLVERQENLGLFDRIDELGNRDQKNDISEEY